jgi:hypothetical protein
LSSNPQSCLFELWRQHTAPIFHMSEFWPAFSETSVLEFIAGRADQPSPTRQLNTAAAQDAKARIEHFLDLMDASDAVCAPVYREYETERLAALALVLEPDNSAATARANDLLYGPLSELEPAAALGYLAYHIDKLKPASAAVSEAKGLLAHAWTGLPRDPDTIPKQFEAINDYRLALRPFIARRFGTLEHVLGNHAGQTTLSSAEVQEVLDRGLTAILGGQRGKWHAALKTGAPNVFIDPARQAVTIPAGRTYSVEHVNNLVVHEIGVHVLRAVKGAASREPLAGFGLPGYGPTEEAFGVLLANAETADYRQINSLIPLAVVEYAARPSTTTFRQVYDFARALIIGLSNPNDSKYPLKEAEYSRAAFSRTCRVLKTGTTNLVERSTTKYWRGQLLLCRYFDSAGLNQTTFDELFEGKYDALSHSQLDLIRRHTA